MSNEPQLAGLDDATKAKTLEQSARESLKRADGLRARNLRHGTPNETMNKAANAVNLFLLGLANCESEQERIGKINTELQDLATELDQTLPMLDT